MVLLQFTIQLDMPLRSLGNILSNFDDYRSTTGSGASGSGGGGGGGGTEDAIPTTGPPSGRAGNGATGIVLIAYTPA